MKSRVAPVVVVSCLQNVYDDILSNVFLGLLISLIGRMKGITVETTPDFGGLEEDSFSGGRNNDWQIWREVSSSEKKAFNHRRVRSSLTS